MRYLLLILSLLVMSMESQVYNVRISCGTCQSRSGCQGNICLSFSGDVNEQYCYGQSTCNGFGLSLSVSIGECAADFSGKICSSGLCMSGANIDICYGNTTDLYLDGVYVQYQCSNRILKTIMYGGLYGTRESSFWVNIAIPQDCPFTSGRGIYSRCSNDVFGHLCTCCFMSSFQGLSSGYGNCVAQDSPITQVKSSLKGKYGFQSLFSFFLLAALALVLII